MEPRNVFENMETAYDPKPLLAEAGKVGVTAVKGLLHEGLTLFGNWFEVSVKKSPTPYDDLALVVVPKVLEMGHNLINQI